VQCYSNSSCIASTATEVGVTGLDRDLIARYTCLSRSHNDYHEDHRSIFPERYHDLNETKDVKSQCSQEDHTKPLRSLPCVDITLSPNTVLQIRVKTKVIITCA